MSRCVIRHQKVDLTDSIGSAESVFAKLATTNPTLAARLQAVDFEAIYLYVAEKALARAAEKTGAQVTASQDAVGCLCLGDLSLTARWVRGQGLELEKSQYNYDYLEKASKWKELEAMEKAYIDSFRDIWLEEIFAIVADSVEVRENDDGELIISMELEVDDG